MVELPPLTYGKVVGRFLANIIDGPDPSDLPEFPPLKGTLTFTAEAPKILVTGADPPATYVQLPKHYECPLDEFGHLTWRGKRGVRLVAPGPATNPTGWTWRVSFDLYYDGDRVPIDAFSFTVGEYVPGPDPAHPDAGSTGLVDLTRAAPVPSTPGTGITRGERGAGIQIDGQVATHAQLPATPADGAQYLVQADGLLYVYQPATGGWPPSGAGIVIRGPAGTTTWTGITDRPATFPADPHTHLAAEISNSSPVGRAVVTAADAPAARTAIGAVGTARQISTGTGLTGGGDLAADRTLEVSFGNSAGTVCAGTDPRLSDPRTPTTAGQVYDICFVAQTGTRAVGAGNTSPQGLKLRRNVRLTEVTYRGHTSDASGALAAELRKNGSPVTGTSVSVAAANQVAGATASGTWDFDTGDVLTVYLTATGTTPGSYLVADIKGVTR